MATITDNMGAGEYYERRRILWAQANIMGAGEYYGRRRILWAQALRPYR